MSIDSYTPPVNRLLTYGHCSGAMAPEQWPDYVQTFGLTAEHIPELIRMMTDTDCWDGDLEDLEIWATTHAWRALAQLKAVEVVEPLLGMFEQYEDDDDLNEETPEVLVQLGPEILPILKAQLKSDRLPEFGKIAIVEGLRKIGERYPESQKECIELFQQQLETYLENGEGLNGWLVEGLIQFQALDAVPLIEKVYAEGDIDEMCAGTWPRVQVRLGLKQRSDFKPSDFVPEFVRQFQANLSGEPKISAEESGLPLNRGAYLPESPSKFKELLKAPKPIEKKTLGFGQQGAATQKSKKKKKS